MSRFRISVFLILLFTAACSQTETTIVRTQAISPSATAEDTDLAQPARRSSTLRVAELTPFETFDPLLARTSADLRRIQLAYEGLMRLDAEGRPVPALASSVEVSADSLLYTIRLRDNAFYHNDPAFSNGIGRKVNANDVVAVFERMTRRDTPTSAAELFETHLLGFDIRNRENRDLFIPAQRMTTEIAGVVRVDSRTVRFQLTSPDAWFLHRLASPRAVIYAPEAVAVMHQRPVGSGPFRFQSASGDTLQTFVLNTAHPDTAQFRIRRIDIRSLDSETRAYRSLMLKETDVISESGPVLAVGIPDLGPETVTIHRFVIPDQTSFRWNPRNVDGLDFPSAAGWFRAAWSDSLSREFSRTGYELSFLVNGAPRRDRMSAAFKLTSHPHEDQISRRMVLQLRKQGGVDLLKGFAVSRDVTFHAMNQPRQIPGQRLVSTDDLVRFDIRAYRLSHPGVTGFRGAPHSWWFDLRGVELTR